MPDGKFFFKGCARQFPVPYWVSSESDVALYHGDVRSCLRSLPDRSFHTVITSPPYWRLRSYIEEEHPDKRWEIGTELLADCGTYGHRQCGDCYVCAMISVMREVYRVMRDDGSLWLNLGDTYRNGQLLIPSRVALAMMVDGWRLVQDVIWYAPDKMPESVTNRCTKSHEHLFLFAKTDDCYFDHIAILEKSGNSASGYANKRDVWVIPTPNYSGAHFAVFNPKLVETCILAGTSRCGVCAECGRQYERIVNIERAESRLSNGGNCIGKQHSNPRANGSQTSNNYREITNRDTLGWAKVCGCGTTEVTPPLVLDPFMGSGTVAAVGVENNCSVVGIDLSQSYLNEHAIPRVQSAVRDGTVDMPTVFTSHGIALPVQKVL